MTSPLASESLPKAFEPTGVEQRWSDYWQAHGLFHPEADVVTNGERQPFTLMIPPPNVTGILTMGHVLNNTLQDVLVRRARMGGLETLWLPGTDHAGIATQVKVEQFLKQSEGLTKHDMSREAFVGRVWDWKDRYGGIIIEQLKKLGASCDWERERFTLDEGLSAAVTEVFVRLYEKGLIYKGHRIINWSPLGKTALSDEEVLHKEVEGHLWHFAYPLDDDSSQSITVATTRPETMLGDVAVAVHPDDERYQQLIGRHVRLPLVDRLIPIVADAFVDPTFGSGAVKVTPAHDPNDFEVGQRLGLPQIVVMNPDGTMSPETGAYAGMDRFEARKAVVTAMQDAGRLVRIEPHLHSVGFAERTGEAIEPYLSEQWFVKMAPLAEPALRAVRDGAIRFYPERWTKTYEHWMTNIRDWCISRQLLWGHRIPAWTTPEGRLIVARTEAEAQQQAGDGVTINRDPDVLDTWFSSWLWPFSTLGWPERTEDLKAFYPTNDLVTAPDIIFFWVARMIMAGIEFTGEVPFRNVYFTGIIRDKLGRKMSKSLGNSPDPLQLISTWGADGLRAGILLIAPQGQDIRFDESSVEVGRNFANKLWNAFRFLHGHLEPGVTYDAQPPGELELVDRWMLSRLHSATATVELAMSKYRFNDAISALYDLSWRDFCDWYVEAIKPRLFSDDAEAKRRTVGLALSIYEQIVTLLHPFMPFITEEIWQLMRPRPDGASLCIAPIPTSDPARVDERAEASWATIQALIVAVRNVRAERNVAPSRPMDLLVNAPDDQTVALVQQNMGYLERLARVGSVSIAVGQPAPDGAVSTVVDGLEVHVPLAGLIDVAAEAARLDKEIAKLSGLADGIERKLSNEGFLAKAPAEVVEKEREKMAGYRADLEKLAAARTRLN